MNAGQKWEIDVDRHINATTGSEVIIQCNFTIPPKYDTENPKVYWKKMVKSNFDTGDKHDQNAFVYHKNETFVLEKYRGKTSLIGDIKKRNCTLKIRNIEARDQDIYVRVIAKDAYSFREFPTTIYVNGKRFIFKYSYVLMSKGKFQLHIQYFTCFSHMNRS